jgi:H+/Cl- antiporter ClcA
LLLPMMAASVIAFGVSRTLCRTPIYDALAVTWKPPVPTPPHPG